MSLKDLAQPESWMNQEERHTAATLIAAFQQHFADRGIPESPFLTLRLKDCLLLFTLCNRLEHALLSDSANTTAATAAHIGRARERLRRAIKNLEDTANRLTPPAEPRPGPVVTNTPSMKSPSVPPKCPDIPAAINSGADNSPKNPSFTGAEHRGSPRPTASAPDTAAVFAGNGYRAGSNTPTPGPSVRPAAAACRPMVPHR